MSKKPDARKSDPAQRTQSAHTNRMISLAEDLAEQKLIDGSASNQLIIYYLKLGTVKEELELEKLRAEQKLIDAKIDSLHSAQQTEELYAKALDAMKIYSGNRDNENI